MLSDEVIRQEFSKFGEVVDFYRPINLAHRKKEPTRHIFVRYMDPYQVMRHSYLIMMTIVTILPGNKPLID